MRINKPSPECFLHSKGTYINIFSKLSCVVLLNTWLQIISSANCLMHISSLSLPWLAEPQLVINSWLISVKLLRADSNFIVIYCLLSTYLRHLSLLNSVCILLNMKTGLWHKSLRNSLIVEFLHFEQDEPILVETCFHHRQQLRHIAHTLQRSYWMSPSPGFVNLHCTVPAKFNFLNSEKTITKCQILIINN